MDLKQVLTDIARAIVDTPDSVTVEETVDGDDIKFVLRVAEEDTGMVIGHHGKIAKAMYTLALPGVASPDPKSYQYKNWKGNV